MDSHSELVSIGLPVYSRPRMLRDALGCLQDQSYDNIEIIISDDCSPGDGTREVVEKAASQDRRIRSYRQERNLGPRRNHMFVFEQARGKFFFWASEDDKVLKRYVETAVEALSADAAYSAWCCSVGVIDAQGSLVRRCEGFSRFTAAARRSITIERYLRDPEIMGKANIFFAVYKRDVLKIVLDAYAFNSRWGSDMCQNLAFISRFDLLGSDEILFLKRWHGSDADIAQTVRRIEHGPRIVRLPVGRWCEYTWEAVKAVPLRYRWLVLRVMFHRLIRGYISVAERAGPLA